MTFAAEEGGEILSQDAQGRVLVSRERRELVLEQYDRSGMSYSLFSEATHTGHIELGTYLKFNPQGTAVVSFLYGPQNGEWVDWVALEGAGYLLDCMEISARIFRVRSTREFDLLFKPILRRNDEMIKAMVAAGREFDDAVKAFDTAIREKPDSKAAITEALHTMLKKKKACQAFDERFS